LKEQLVAAFRDHTTEQKARDKLEYLRQGEKQSIDTFFILFDTLAAECNVTTDQQLIYLLDWAVLDKYIHQIVTMQAKPTMYKAYKDIILRIARYHEQWEEQLRFERCCTHFFHGPRDRPHPEPPQPPQQDRRTGMGVVFGRQGKAMDVDAARQQNRCYNCGKVGHFKRDCPDLLKQKFNARALAMDLSDEEKQELVDQILPEDEENTDQVFESVDI
jgi:hypothetical protein